MAGAACGAHGQGHGGRGADCLSSSARDTAGEGIPQPGPGYSEHFRCRSGRRLSIHGSGTDGGCPGGASGMAGKEKPERSEEHTSELQSLMRISYAVFCLKTKTTSEELIQVQH